MIVAIHTGVVARLVAFGFGDFVGVLALVEGGGAVVVGVGVARGRRGRLGGAAALASSWFQGPSLNYRRTELKRIL